MKLKYGSFPFVLFSRSTCESLLLSPLFSRSCPDAPSRPLSFYATSTTFGTCSGRIIAAANNNHYNYNIIQEERERQIKSNVQTHLLNLTANLGRREQLTSLARIGKVTSTNTGQAKASWPKGKWRMSFNETTAVNAVVLVAVVVASSRSI